MRQNFCWKIFELYFKQQKVIDLYITCINCKAYSYTEKINPAETCFSCLCNIAIYSYLSWCVGESGYEGFLYIIS